ncbi:hypothetical protein DSO57_1000934 [Entomophthora muscae]|uniref:Uncharacterized protein n=1 Tax=Entomophthora muscae TaxID=34485 RepID=A0ACC2TJU2_9FUNG|nr:hypothetical protein DSO57_1000934 [Entomophthora muscae]
MELFPLQYHPGSPPADQVKRILTPLQNSAQYFIFRPLRWSYWLGPAKGIKSRMVCHKHLCHQTSTINLHSRVHVHPSLGLGLDWKTITSYPPSLTPRQISTEITLPPKYLTKSSTELWIQPLYWGTRGAYYLATLNVSSSRVTTGEMDILLPLFRANRPIFLISSNPIKSNQCIHL